MDEHQLGELRLIREMHQMSSLSFSGPHVTNYKQARFDLSKRDDISRPPSVRSFDERASVDSRWINDAFESIFSPKSTRSRLVSAGNLKGISAIAVCCSTGMVISSRNGAPHAVWRDPQQVCELTFSQVNGNHWIILIHGNPALYCFKYGVRGYRYLLLEAGHLGELIISQANENGIGSCPIGAFNDQLATYFIGEFETQSIPLYSVAIGVAKV